MTTGRKWLLVVGVIAAAAAALALVVPLGTLLGSVARIVFQLSSFPQVLSPYFIRTVHEA